MSNSEFYYKNLLSLCLEHTDNLFLILSEDLVIKNINPVAEKTLGWNKQDVFNRNISDVFKEKSMNPFIKLQDSVRINNNTYLLNKNKKIKIVWSIVSTNDTEKKDTTILVIGKKETEIAEDKLEILQLQNAIKYAPGFFYWKDIDSVYQGCNEEFVRLAGLQSREDVKGKTDFDLIWKDRAELYVAIDKEVIRSGIPILNHVEVITVSSNKIITAITNKVPMLDNHGRIIGILGITTDITHQKEIEQALSVAKELAEVANHAKTEFIANMSHDIRTPLSGVVGMSKIMKDITNDPQQKQYAHWINESGEQLLNLLNGILDVISAENMNDTDLVHETFDLHSCIQDIVQLETPTIQLKNLDLKIDIQKDIPKFFISDRTKLHRTLLNLLGNSIKFTPKGYVAISVSLIERLEEYARLRFSISDTGIGIPDELQSKVFDRFFRVDPSYKGIYKGQGIGLHIAQSHVKLLGGEIKVQSKMNQGTTFYFELLMKIAREEENINPSSACNTNDHTSARKAIKYSPTLSKRQEALRLLLIEDNPIALRTIEMIAADEGYQYSSAENAELGFELIQSTPFDIIITDIGLPGMSGTELSHAIRLWEQASGRKPVPIIGLTAHTGKSEIQKYLQSGMNKILIKPASVTMIQNVIAELITGNEQTEQISKVTISTSKQGALGPDLPETEEELFKLEQLPILDIENGLRILGSKSVLKELLTVMLHEGIDADKHAIEHAHAKHDWNKIEALAHKIKGGAAYCGTIKMHRACQYLERYQKAGHSHLKNELYYQLIAVVEQTRVAISEWLDTP
jgi:two-component system, OmpR family, aerobic respiration control sensor histidine kinase ArcB